MQLRSYHRTCDGKRSLFWRCQVASNSRNPRKLCREINTILGRTKRPVQSKLSAVAFAEFFNNKVDIIRKDTENAAPQFFTETACQWFSKFQPVTETEVLKLLDSSANKQSLLDPLPTYLFKKIGIDVAPLVVKILIDLLLRVMCQSVLK